MVSIVKQKDPKGLTLRVYWDTNLDKLLFEAGRFASALAHEIKLRPADNTMAFDHDLINARRAEQERALDADAVGSHAANRDGLVVSALAHADHRALELLNTFSFPFFDLDVYADVIASLHGGYFFVLLGFESLDNVCHCLSS